MRKPKLRELKEAVTALVKGPYTSKFPKVPPTVPEHFRGTPSYVPDDCVGCGACGQVCPAGAITIIDEYREEKGMMVRRIERDWAQCIFCSQCFEYCITGKGIKLDPDFEKSCVDKADAIDTHDKELLFCESCGNPVTAKDHIHWINDQLGELVFTTLTKEGLPLVRYRTRDRTILHTETCACGRTMVRMEKVLGRTDDMLVIRGVNVFPSQVEHVLLEFEELEPHYVIYVDRERDRLDTLEVWVEASQDLYGRGNNGLGEVTGRVKNALQENLYVSTVVKVVEPDAIQRSIGKAKRVVDRRELG